MDDLNQLLVSQENNVAQLLRVLKEETTIIASKKASDIENIAQKKLALLIEVDKQDKQLAKALQNKSLNDENNAHIDHIKAILQQCHLHNDANGIALQRASLSMHKLKNLFEESMGKNEMTYDENGKASNSHTLGTNIKT